MFSFFVLRNTAWCSLANSQFKFDMDKNNMKNIKTFVFLIMAAFLLSGCIFGNGDNNGSTAGDSSNIGNNDGDIDGPSDSTDTTDTATAPANAATATLSYNAIKGFTFTWTDVSDATYYRLQENPDGVSGFTQVGEDVSAGTQTLSISVPLFRRLNAQYILQSCNAIGCVDSTQMTVDQQINNSIGYIKSSNTATNDIFAEKIALSADGNTLAVAATLEDSSATGIDGDQLDNTTINSGAVYVFIRNGIAWSQQAYIKASNANGNDLFGQALSLSADGNTLAVGAPFEDSNATGINGNQNVNFTSDSGAAYVFTRNGSTWSQEAYVKASNTEAYDRFGIAVSLSSDGNTLAVGASFEHGGTTGVGGDQMDNTAEDSGAAYVFVRTGSSWSQQAYIKASNSEAFDRFAEHLSVSGDGNTLAVSSYLEDSSSTGINSGESANDAVDAGAVYIFTRTGSAWNQQAYIKASNAEAGDYFGLDVSLSDDGNTLAVGAPREDSNATGIDGDASNNTAGYSGAVYLFSRDSSTWSQQAYIKASNTGSDDRFGESVSLSADSQSLAVGAYREDSSAVGINADQMASDITDTGAAYVFIRSGTTWSQQMYIKASNSGLNDSFGMNVALSTDGNTLAVAADRESSSATGIGGDQSDDSAVNAGAVYLY